MTEDVLATRPYVEALQFARSLRAPDEPLEFPSYSDFVRLVAERVEIDREFLDEDLADFQEVPEAYQLAYLTARLERLRERILAETGVDVRHL
jgi:hypothetical protein